MSLLAGRDQVSPNPNFVSDDSDSAAFPFAEGAISLEYDFEWFAVFIWSVVSTSALSLILISSTSMWSFSYFEGVSSSAGSFVLLLVRNFNRLLIVYFPFVFSRGKNA